MTLKLNSSSGGSVSLNAPSTVSDYTLTLPTQTGTVATTGDIRAIDVQTFTSSGTWTKPAGYAAGSRVYVQAWGAGGSGGRNSTAANMGGGGGGGYAETWLTLSQFGATETITIGAGGVSRTGSNQTGAVGGTTTVGSLISAYGGGGGGTFSGTGIVNGGGGGGMLSAGNDAGGSSTSFSLTSAGYPGLPFFHGGTIKYNNNSPDAVAIPQGSGTGAHYVTSTTDACSNVTHHYVNVVAVDAFMTGGGGGASAGGLSGQFVGGKSVWGGGGGGGGATSGANGGVSLYGGNGGAAGTTGTAGTQPGGGGGGGTSTSGAGGNGKVIITVFPA